MRLLLLFAFATFVALVLQTTLGAALMATQGYASPDVERTNARARELCERLGDTPHLFQAHARAAEEYRELDVAFRRGLRGRLRGLRDKGHGGHGGKQCGSTIMGELHPIRISAS